MLRQRRRLGPLYAGFDGDVADWGVVAGRGHAVGESAAEARTQDKLSAKLLNISSLFDHHTGRHGKQRPPNDGKRTPQGPMLDVVALVLFGSTI